MKRILFYAIIVAIASLGLTFGGCSNDDSSTNPIGVDTSKIYFGSLLSTSGDWRDLGQSAIAAISVAIKEMNDTLRAHGANFRLAVRDEDTQLNPEQALQCLELLMRDSAYFVIGPQSSAEAQAILSYANLNKITLISPSSTASSLAVPNDYLFRLAPREASEAQAVAQKIYNTGVRHIITVSADDAGNLGLTSAMANAFIALGGGTSAVSDLQMTSETNYAELALSLADEVNLLKGRFSTETIAVLVNGFDGTAALLASAGEIAELGTVAWFAGDGVAQNTAVSNNTSAAQFAVKVNLRAAIFDVTDAKRAEYSRLIDTVTKLTGIAPNAFALSCYDAVKLIGYSYLEKGRKASREELQAAMVAYAATYNGVTGATKFDANGDREDSYFAFYQVYKNNYGYYAWRQEAAKR